jgi:hypothetical protein
MASYQPFEATATHRSATHFRTIIGIYEMICGVGGAIFAISVLTSRPAALTAPGWWIGFVLCVLLFPAGWYLQRNKRIGAWLSFAVQMPQTVFWSVSGIVWKCEIGLFLTPVLFGGSHFGIFYGVNVTALAGWGVLGAPLMLGVDVVPILIIVLALRSVGGRVGRDVAGRRDDGE